MKMVNMFKSILWSNADDRVCPAKFVDMFKDKTHWSNSDMFKCSVKCIKMFVNDTHLSHSEILVCSVKVVEMKNSHRSDSNV